jgi:dTDP-4-amino-4,6-dideoxygalactose transaminase
LIERAEIIRDKGTNRSQFFRNQVDKYTWVDIGSSYLPGELISAFLWAQLQSARVITRQRRNVWINYHQSLDNYEQMGLLRRPIIPKYCQHNYHIYYVLLPSLHSRDNFIADMKSCGVQCVFHYVPLHNSPIGSIVGITNSSLEITTDLSLRLVRLPIWHDLNVDFVVNSLQKCIA